MQSILELSLIIAFAICRLGEVGKQEQKMRSELARFKQQVQAQRDASALHLRQLQQPSPADSTSEAVSALSASIASSKPFPYPAFLPSTCSAAGSGKCILSLSDVHVFVKVMLLQAAYHHCHVATVLCFAYHSSTPHHITLTQNEVQS